MVKLPAIFKRGQRDQLAKLPSIPRQPPSVASSNQHGGGGGSPRAHRAGQPQVSLPMATPTNSAHKRRTPEQYRLAVQAVSSPSQLSLTNLTEYYDVADQTNTNSVNDVYKSRGYKRLNKIDEGAFGIVSKGQRLNDMCLVAFKEVDLRRKKAKRIEEMKRELFVLQKIEHPNVVRMFEHFIIGQQLVIIMEFCAGGNMTSYLKEKSIAELEGVSLFKQMALAIKVLHRRGISHRDVKLNNFLLDSTRTRVKIADFGLSIVSYRRKYGVFLAKTYCGTEPYMAPELLKRNSLGVRQYNPFCADVWSLGVCLFAMLTRSFPFRVQASQPELLKAQLMRKWRFPRGFRGRLSEEVKDIISHMLDPEEPRRITINGILTHRWLNNATQSINLSLEESDSSMNPIHKLSSRTSNRSRITLATNQAESRV